MRDILTFVAGFVILVLVAALAVPPLVPWESYRSWVERGISRALDREVRTDGFLDLRLLPTPRLRVQRLRVGRGTTLSASLDAMYVRAELALTPLLGGEVRFLDTRIGRAEVKLPIGAGTRWQVPAAALSEAASRKAWAFEETRIEQLLVTTVDPATGRTDQYVGEGVRFQASSVLGPLRLDGRSRGVPFEIAVGELAGSSAPLKLGAGGGGFPRLDVDGQLALVSVGNNGVSPRLTGMAKLVAGNEAFPLVAQAKVTAESGIAEFADLAVEGGEGQAALRLAGAARLDLDRPAATVALAGRRADLVALRRSLGNASAQAVWPVAVPVPVDVSLKLDGLAVGADEDLTGLALALRLDGDQARVDSLQVSGPGRSTLSTWGTVSFGSNPSASGRLTLEAGDAQRFARAIEPLGVRGVSGFVEPRPLTVSTEFSVVDPVLSLRALRIVQGDLQITGTVRHTGAEDGKRPRVDAQLAIQGLDVSALPQGAGLFALTRDRDLGLTLDARNILHAGRRGGRISGRIATEGASVLVEALEVRDLAGAQASLSGRIGPDGAGRIEGQLSAPQAAPLLDLFGQAWIGGAARLLPADVRDDAVDLRVEVEQTGAGGDPSIRTRVRGKLGGAPFEADTQTSKGRLASFVVRSDLDALLGTGRGVPAPAPTIMFTGRRGEGGAMTVDAQGRIASLTLRTTSPMVLGSGDDLIDTAQVLVEGPDAAAVLTRAGIAPSVPVPVALSVSFARRPEPSFQVTGDIAKRRVSADIVAPGPFALRGRVSVDRLALPWLVSALVLGPIPSPAAGALWPASRFANPPDLPVAGSLDVKVAAFDLGGGIEGRDGSFALAFAPSTLRVSRLDLATGDARIRGEVGLDRQGGLAVLSGDAALEGLWLPRLLSAPFSQGRAAARLRFGASGESVAGLVANLGGAGDVTIDGLRIDATDPAGPMRLAGRVLRTDDPIASQRWQPWIGEELGRGPLVAAKAVMAPGALVGGALRLSPLRIEADGGGWQGTASLDLRNLTFDMRGVLQSAAGPRNWTGGSPVLGIGWSGPLGRVSRSVDTAPLISGLATNVLARELDRVDTFDLDAAERKRRNSREDMDRQRKTDEARRLRERTLTIPVPIPLPPPLPYGFDETGGG